jgi:hypothetical protein
MSVLGHLLGVPGLASTNLRLPPILAKFANTQNEVGISRIGSSYYLWQKQGAGRYLCASLPYATTGTASYNSLRRLDYQYLVVDESVVGNAAVTRTGAGWAFGTTYYRTEGVGDYTTHTTPDNTVVVGIKGQQSSNAGISLVTIDGDRTRATKLPTAQQLVDAGALPNTILITNGGTLNPTDRLLDQYAVTTPHLVVLADDLTPGVHQVVVTCTGYKNPLSTAARTYSKSVLYATTTTNLVTPGTAFVPEQAIFSDQSVFEYALAYQPSGASDFALRGNGHGYDYQSSWSVKLDGVDTTVNDGEYKTGSLVQITRLSALRHPEVGAGATDVGASTVIYTMRPDTGLWVDWSISWLVDGDMRSAYVAMMPLDESVSSKGATELGSDVILTAHDDSELLQTASRYAYAWQAAGQYGAIMYVDNIPAAVNGWTYTATGKKMYIQDRAGGVFNKLYLMRVSNATEPYLAGDVWQSRINYRVMRFADANAALAR